MIETIKKLLEAQNFAYVRETEPKHYELKHADNKPSGEGWTLLDVYSASAVNGVYEALTGDSQSKFAGLNISHAVNIAFKLLKK